MTMTKLDATPTHTFPHASAQDNGFVILKVYLTQEEKREFQQEAALHRQKESQYARFILNARQDPMMFLQLCRLRDPGFAAGLMGNPAEAGKVADLEKRLMEATHEADTLLKERADLERRNEELERQLAEAADRARDLAAQVVDLAKLQGASRERAMTGDVEYEASAKPFLAVIRTLRIAGRMTKKELEAALIEEAKMSAADAAQAVTQAGRLGIIVKGADARFRLAKPVQEVDE